MQLDLFDFPGRPRYRNSRPGRLRSSRQSPSRLGSLIGKTFSGWTIEAKRFHHHGKIWLARHTCGATRWFGANELTRGQFKVRTCRKCLERPDLRLRPYEALYNGTRLRCQQAGHVFSLTYEEFLKFTCIHQCHYCHAPITWAEYNARGVGIRSRYNLDRKDNAQGYFKQNLVVCCKRCNWSKGNRYTYAEWWLKCAPERAARLLGLELTLENGGWLRAISDHFKNPDDWERLGPVTVAKDSFNA